MERYCKIILGSGQISAASRETLANAVKTFGATDPNGTLVIHFHGGLVNHTNADAIAARLGPEYASSSAFPVFVIWQTGLLETLRNNWTEVFSKEFFEGVLERVLQFLVGKAEQPPGAKGAPLQIKHPRDIRQEISKRAMGEEPFGAYPTQPQSADWELKAVEQRQFEDAIGRDAKISAATEQLVGGDDIEQFEPELRNEVASARADREKGSRSALTAIALGVGLKALMGTLRRFHRGRGHGLYPTAFEEVAKAIFPAELLGRFAWGAMKQDTKDAFGTDHETFGGSALLHEIEQIWQKGGRPRVILVGHSAGSIFVCEMLKAAAKNAALAGLKFEIVLLAPACTFKLLDDTLTLAPHQIADFRCFAMSDELEQKDSLIKGIYPRSLLYFVSGVLENEADEPLVGMHRFHTRTPPFDDEAFPNIKRVLDHLQAHQNGWVWSLSSSGEGLNTECTTHGGFDDEKTTIESIKYFIRSRTMAQ
ncbi:MAG: hypothetical protein JWR80_9623 [Bradyrhizobium sp.]|nr:hypothetical protein [Bradyrhizobium sp.]